MLTRVLLHVIESPRPVNLAPDLGPGEQRFQRLVPHLAVLIFFYSNHGNFEDSPAPGGRRYNSEVIGLPAARGVKSRTLQRNLPDRLPIGPRKFANIGHTGRKAPQK